MHAKALLLATTTALALALALAACSPQDKAAPAASLSPAQSYDSVARQGKGFTAGALMSANTVYVLFDPQCPHCGHLWQASIPLQGKLKFVWMPVSILNNASAPQGAALLTAANPVEAMTAHEASILSGQGGISASSSIPDDIAEAIKANTALFNRLGADSVPLILAKDARTGQVVTRTGALDTAGLAAFLGLN